MTTPFESETRLADLYLCRGEVLPRAGLQGKALAQGKQGAPGRRDTVQGWSETQVTRELRAQGSRRRLSPTSPPSL